MQKLEMANHIVRFEGDWEVAEVDESVVRFTDGSWCDVSTGRAELHSEGVISWAHVKKPAGIIGRISSNDASNIASTVSGRLKQRPREAGQ